MLMIDIYIRIIDGSMNFEINQALFGGGLHLDNNSKLILPSSTQNAISFVLNYAYSKGVQSTLTILSVQPLKKSVFFLYVMITILMQQNCFYF